MLRATHIQPMNHAALDGDVVTHIAVGLDGDVHDARATGVAEVALHGAAGLGGARPHGEVLLDRLREGPDGRGREYGGAAEC